MSEIQYSVEVKDVEKHFKVYMDKGSTLKERAIFHNRNRHENRQILDGISFEIPKGQAVGLIGRNGCGKSTTLKLLTKILKPNSGIVKVEGRVSSLIELGAGFHPDMSGRENIYINATIFGIHNPFGQPPGEAYSSVPMPPPHTNETLFGPQRIRNC